MAAGVAVEEEAAGRCCCRLPVAGGGRGWWGGRGRCGAFVVGRRRADRRATAAPVAPEGPAAPAGRAAAWTSMPAVKAGCADGGTTSALPMTAAAVPTPKRRRGGRLSQASRRKSAPVKRRAATGLDSDMGRLPFHSSTRRTRRSAFFAARHRRVPGDAARTPANDDEEVEQDLGVARRLDAARERGGVARFFGQIRQPAAQPPRERVRPESARYARASRSVSESRRSDVRQLVHEDGIEHLGRPLAPAGRQHHRRSPHGHRHRHVERRRTRAAARRDRDLVPTPGRPVRSSATRIGDRPTVPLEAKRGEPAARAT